MAASTAWWLNLDAERELADPEDYRPDPRIQARIVELTARLGSLLGAHASVIGVDAPDPVAQAWAWCPTPHAVRAIEAAGLTPPLHPPLHVLQRVNHRSFCAALGQTLPGAQQVTELSALRELVRKPSPSGDWVIKRPWGFAGRERRRAIRGVLDPSTEGFARLALERGQTLQVEPWVSRVQDAAIHGWLARGGTLYLAEPVTQHCDNQGRYQRPGEPLRSQDELTLATNLRREGEAVGQALATAGYFGPFGVDGYSYLDAKGARQINPRSEINARFTMGYRWPSGLGPRSVVALG